MSIPHVWRVSANYAKSIVCTILSSSGNVCAGGGGGGENQRSIRTYVLKLS